MLRVLNFQALATAFLEGLLKSVRLPSRLIAACRSVINFVPCNVTEVQGETQHFGNLGDEPMARSETASDRGLG